MVIADAVMGPAEPAAAPSATAIERAIVMYTEDSSLSAIGRVLGYSVQAVSQWVKKGG